jgi:3-deoxy-manno-octulosonate cytidylyltransferase (CMP-KDO synthetase)
MRGALVVIPSRYGSTRFPGKVLAKLGGRTIVEWCWRAAVAAKVGPVLVATEDERVVAAVEGFGGRAVLTSARCVSGSDRVFEAARGSRAPFVINLQGDQPLIRPATIRAVARLLRRRGRADMTTAVMPLTEESRGADPNVVKAALAGDGRALYFSRSPIPFRRGPEAAVRFEHLGIYGFRRAALSRFVALPPSPLERSESLEQLRALEDGMLLYAAVVADHPVAIDTPQDLRRAERLLKSMKRRGKR